MTYATLKTDIAGYLHRNDLTANIPGFIALAEAYMLRELALREVETSATGVTAGATIALPADFASLVRLTVTHGSTEHDLDLASQALSYAASTGVPQSYKLESNALRLFPAPTSGYTYTLYYRATISPLSDSVTTNWLLTNAPDLYLYASCLEGAKHIRDMEQVGALSAQVGPLLDSVRRLSERKGQPARGGMQIKPRRM